MTFYRADRQRQLLCDLLADDTETKAVGGLEMGAVPIALSIAMKSNDRGRRIDAFFVRKEVKDHGTAKLIDGNFAPGSKVIVLEDVTTTGGSAMKAVEAVREAGAEVVLVLTMVDREEGATETFLEAGLTFRSLYKATEFLND